MYSASGADSVMEYDVGNAYHIMIIIKLKHKYVVVENMKFNSKHPSKYLVLKIYKQFDFIAAVLLNCGCEGQIKVRCEMFDKFDIAIHLSIH